jgi:hypothetical protein
MGAKDVEADGALRSPPAVLMAVTHVLGREQWAERLQKAVAMSVQATQEEPFWHATHLLVLQAAE